jgi:hypothetical protein
MKSLLTYIKQFINNRQARLNILFVNLLILGLTISIVTYLFGVYNVVPNVHFQFTQLQSWTDWFSFTPLTLLLTGVGTVIAGLVSVLLKANTYAIYAMLIAALGLIIRPIQEILTAIPTAIGLWLPNEANPFAYTNGIYNPNYTGLNPITVVVSALFLFAGFWFVLSLVIQRDL